MFSIPMCCTGGVITPHSTSCDFCGHPIPVPNQELHQLRCQKQTHIPTDGALLSKAPSGRQRMNHQDLKSSSENNARRPTANASQVRLAGRRRKNKGGIGKIDADLGEDLDSLLAEMKLADERCNFPGCRKSVNLLGMKCQFCCSRFCVSHSLAEIHGCGEAVKKHSRQQIAEQLRGRGSGRKLKSVDPTRRVQLQKRLDRKIGDLSSERQRKKPSNSS